MILIRNSHFKHLLKKLGFKISNSACVLKRWVFIYNPPMISRDWKNKQITVLTNASLHLPGGSVADPLLFQFGSGSSILGQCGSGSGSKKVLWPKTEKITAEKKIIIFLIKICSLSLCPHNRRQSYRRSQHPALQKHDSPSHFFYFCGSSWIRIYPTNIIVDPDPQHCRKDLKSLDLNSS